MLPFLQRHPSCQHNEVHGELLGAEVSVEKVNREDESRCQQRFVAVNDGRHVKDPSRQNPGSQFWKPQHQARRTNDSYAPKDREVVELLPVGPTPVLGPRPSAQKPLERCNELLDVCQGRHNGVGTQQKIYWFLAAFLVQLECIPRGDRRTDQTSPRRTTGGRNPQLLRPRCIQAINLAQAM